MKIIDFRFRPNTPEIINGIKNSAMFKAACKAIGFDSRKAQPLPVLWRTSTAWAWSWA